MTAPTGSETPVDDAGYGDIAGVALLPWESFVERFRWRQGEHVALIGPTGSGKTNAAFWLLPMRQYVVILGTKPKDISLEKFGKRHGYKRIKEWGKLSPKRWPRRILWPEARSVDAAAKQAAAFSAAMSRIYVEGGWTLYVDELWFFCHVLKLTHLIKVYLQQARSLQISLVVSSQRPAWIPVEVFDQSTHLFFYRDNDERNLSRMSGIGWLSANQIKLAIASLPEFHVLYVNTRTGTMVITKLPPPPE